MVEHSVTESTNILIAYKKGGLNLNEATALFSNATGLNKEAAETFLHGMTRTNVKTILKKELAND